MIDFRPSGSRRFHAVALLAIAAVTMGAYANAREGQFVFDDEYVVRCEQIRSLRNLPALFTTRFLEIEQIALYRPLVSVTYALNHALDGLNPPGYHVFDLLVHLANGLLIYPLVLLLLRSRRVALLTALLFAAHPIHTEVVASVIGRSESLTTFFVLGAWILYVKARSSQRRPRAYLLFSLLAFLLALLSKESAIASIGLLILYDLCFPAPTRIHGLAYVRRLILTYLPYFGIFGLYLILRRLVLGAFVAQHVAFHNNPLAYASFYPRLLTVLKVSGRYLRLLVLPLTLSSDYSYNQVPVATSLFEPEVVIALFVLILCVFAGVLSCRRTRTVLLALGLFVIPFSIVSNAIVSIGTIMAERLMYFPSLGFCLLVGIGLDAMYRFRGYLRPVAAGLAVLILSGYVCRTVLRNRDWRDEYIFFSRMVQTSPNSAKAHYNLGTVYKRRELFQKAIAEYRRAQEIEPGLPVIGYNLANVYKDLGRFEQAIVEYRRVLRVNPDLPEVHYNLAIVYRRVGRMDEAIEEYTRVLELSPNHVDARNNLGNLYRAQGRLDEAIREFEIVLSTQPDLAEAYYNLASIYEEKGLAEEAIRSYEKFLRYWRGDFRYAERARQRIEELRAGQGMGR